MRSKTIREHADQHNAKLAAFCEPSAGPELNLGQYSGAAVANTLNATNLPAALDDDSDGDE